MVYFLVWKNWVGIILKNISSCKKYSSCCVGGWYCICNSWSCSAAFPYFYCSPVFFTFRLLYFIYFIYACIHSPTQLYPSWFKDIAEKCEEKWIEGTSQSYDATSTQYTSDGWGLRSRYQLIWSSWSSSSNLYVPTHYFPFLLCMDGRKQKKNSTSASLLLFLQSNKEHREGVIVRWNESKKENRVKQLDSCSFLFFIQNSDQYLVLLFCI